MPSYRKTVYGVYTLGYIYVHNIIILFWSLKFDHNLYYDERVGTHILMLCTVAHYVVRLQVTAVCPEKRSGKLNLNIIIFPLSIHLSFDS